MALFVQVSPTQERACCERFPVDPILVDQHTLQPLDPNAAEPREGGDHGDDGHGGGSYRRSKDAPEIVLRAMHEEKLRPLRHFLLGPLYCPANFGLNGTLNDPGTCGHGVCVGSTLNLRWHTIVQCMEVRTGSME